MYNLPEYKEQDQQKIRSFMEENPFVVVCGVSADHTPVATQVPVLIRQDENGKIYLLGHMMRGTDHFKAMAANPAVLTLFSGAHTYVSASWYTNKQQGSTWNYMTVQAKGKISFLPKEELFALLKETTAHFEDNPNSPSLYENLSQEYIDPLVKAIEGFRIDIESLQHVFKLSQDRDEKSYANIIEQLDGGNEQAQQIAAEMKKRQ